MALLEFGQNGNSPGNSSLDELKIRYFTDPNSPSSAFDFVTFRGKFRSTVIGNNAPTAFATISNETRLAVYDGFDPIPYNTNPPTAAPPFETGAIYGLSNGTDFTNATRSYSAGVIGDVYNSQSTAGGYAILGVGPSAASAPANKWAGYFVGRTYSSAGYLAVIPN